MLCDAVAVARRGGLGWGGGGGSRSPLGSAAPRVRSGRGGAEGQKTLKSGGRDVGPAGTPLTFDTHSPAPHGRPSHKRTRVGRQAIPCRYLGCGRGGIAALAALVRLVGVGAPPLSRLPGVPRRPAPPRAAPHRPAPAERGRPSSPSSSLSTPLS